MLTSKGASGVSGAGFVTLAATLSVVNPALVPGIAIVLGIDKFMSECRALTNITGNGVACVVVSWWEGELDRAKLKEVLSGKRREELAPGGGEGGRGGQCCVSSGTSGSLPGGRPAMRVPWVRAATPLVAVNRSACALRFTATCMRAASEFGVGDLRVPFESVTAG